MIECIEITDPVDENHVVASLVRTKAQTNPLRNLCRACKFPECPRHACRLGVHHQKLQAMQEVWGLRTPITSLWSATTTKMMVLPQGVCSDSPRRTPTRTRTTRSPMCKSWFAWRNLGSLSRNPTRRAESVLVRSDSYSDSYWNNGSGYNREKKNSWKKINKNQH